ncbi:hypothetical protein Tco_0349311 [Tanacetum coccineum]
MQGLIETTLRLWQSRVEILWGLFHKNNVDFAAFIWEDFQYQIDYWQSKLMRQEIIPYPRFTKIIIYYFLSQHKSISIRQGSYINIIKDDGVLGRLKFIEKRELTQVDGNPIPDTMLNDEIKNSESYQTFLALSTGLVPPKIGRGKGAKEKRETFTPKKKSYITADDNILLDPDEALKLGMSISKTKAEITEEEVRVHKTHERLVTKKLMGDEGSDEANDEQEVRLIRRRPTGVVIIDTPNVLKKKSLDQS